MNSFIANEFMITVTGDENRPLHTSATSGVIQMIDDNIEKEQNNKEQNDPKPNTENMPASDAGADTLRLAGVIRESIVDGPGFRFVVFCQGCPHRCEGCHNPESHDFKGGKIYTLEKIMDAVLKDPLLDGVTFSGGEPFCQAPAFAKLGRMLREHGLNIVTYTGYTYEQLQAKISRNEKGIDELLSITDILIDGRYEKDKRDLTLLFRGSTNQRPIDVKATRSSGSIVIHEF